MRQLLLPGFLAAMAAAPAASAQEVVCAEPGPAERPLRLIARVTAEQLEFEARPHTRLVVHGCDAGDTLRVLTRRNLPPRVEAGTVYRDVEVEIEIVTRLRILCLPALRELVASAPAAAPLLQRACLRDTPSDSLTRSRS